MDEHRLRRLLSETAEDVQPSVELEARAYRRYTQRRSRVRVLAAGVVVVIIGAGVAASALAGSEHDATQVVHPAPTTSTTTVTGVSLRAAPAVGFLSAPTDQHTHELSIWDWNGKRVRKVRLDSETGCCIGGALSPDGRRILVGDVVYDARGQRIGAVDVSYGALWADDSRHLCALTPSKTQKGIPVGPANLSLVAPGAAPRFIAQAGGYTPHGGPSIMRCSVTDDEAVVAMDFAGSITSLVTVQLSTGRVTTPGWASGADARKVAAISGNGRYRLEDGPHSLGTTSSNVVNAATDKVVGHVNGQPLAISWNGRLVVVFTNSADIAVVDRTTGTAIWRSARRPPGSPGISSSASVAVRPLSDDIAVTAGDLPGHALNTAELWLLSPGQPPKLLDPAVAR